MESQHVVTLHNVSKSYCFDRREDIVVHAVRDVSLEIPGGSFTFILGPSGSGKTTLLNLIGTLDRPSSGEIRILGTPTTTLSDNQLSDLRNKHIATIFQSFNLIDVLSAQENVEYPLLLQNIPKKEREQRSRSILAALGLEERRRHLPNQLSGGQRQRVAIARALVKNPALILADEPTANLDSRTSHDIMALIEEVQQQFHTTFVVCTHDPEILQHAHQVIHMKDGSITRQEAQSQPRQSLYAA